MLAHIALLLAVTVAEKLIQLSDENTALQFSTQFTAPIIVQLTAGHCVATAHEYSITVWVKLEVPNQGVTPVITVSNGQVLVATVSKDQKNALVAEVAMKSGDVLTARVDGAVPQEWELVTVTVRTGVALSICSTPWRGVPTCSWSFSIGEPVPISIPTALFFLGAGASGPSLQGQLLDTKLILGHAFDRLSIEDSVVAKTCSPSCYAGCWGPGHMSCSNFVQVVSPVEPLALFSSRKTWKLAHPFFQGMKFDGLEGGVSAWVSEAGGSPATYFSASGPAPVFSLKRTVANAFQLCISTHTANLCVESPPGEFRASTWFFVAGWVSYTAHIGIDLSSSMSEYRTVNVCWGAWTAPAVQCQSAPIVGVPAKWDSTVTSFDIGGFDGLLIDANVYKESITTATAHRLFASQRCGNGCQVCTAPHQCGQCLPGYSNRNGICQESQCGDFYIFHQQSVDVAALQTHPVSLYEPFHKSTVTFVTRSGTPVWSVDWGQIPLSATTERNIDWVTVHEAHPMLPTTFLPGSTVSVNVSGAGTYSLYMVMSWPHHNILAKADSVSETDRAELFAVGEVEGPARFHGVLGETAVVRAWGGEYQLVDGEVLLPGTILTGKLSGGVKEYVVDIPSVSDLTLTVTACQGAATIFIVQPSSPAFHPHSSHTSDSTVISLPQAFGRYIVSISSLQTTTFELTLSGLQPLPTGLSDPIWWEFQPESSSVLLMWRPIRWADGLSPIGPVTYIVRSEGLPEVSLDVCRICGLEVEETMAVVPIALHRDNAIEVFAVLTTELGTVAVPLGVTHVRVVLSDNSSVVKGIIGLTSVCILLGVCLVLRHEKADELDRNYKLLAREY